MKPVTYNESATKPQKAVLSINRQEKKQLVGVDVFIDWQGTDPKELASLVEKTADKELRLQMITLLGLKVWPEETPVLHGGDHWRLRFVPNNTTKTTSHKEVTYLLERLTEAGLDFIKTENLYLFDDALGFSLAQAE